MKIQSGQVAVITGAGSGIGRALALACAARGMHLVIADIELTAANETAAMVTEHGVTAIAIEVDVSNPQQINDMAEQCWQQFDACDLLINNAGVSVNKPLAECTASDWQWVFSVNTLAIGYAIAAFLPRMKSQGGGHIVNTASMAGLAPLPHFGPYVASKYAVLGLSETLALETAENRIGVSVLCPGVVNTRIFESERNRPNASTTAQVADNDREGMETDFDSAYSRALTPNEVADIVLEAVIENRLYVITHPEWAPLFQQRSNVIHEAFDLAQLKSPKII